MRHGHVEHEDCHIAGADGYHERSGSIESQCCCSRLLAQQFGESRQHGTAMQIPLSLAEQHLRQATVLEKKSVGILTCSHFKAMPPTFLPPTRR